MSSLLTLIAKWPNRPGGPPRLLILDQEWETMKETKLRASLQAEPLIITYLELLLFSTFDMGY